MSLEENSDSDSLEETPIKQEAIIKQEVIVKQEKTIEETQEQTQNVMNDPDNLDDFVDTSSEEDEDENDKKNAKKEAISEHFPKMVVKESDYSSFEDVTLPKIGTWGKAWKIPAYLSKVFSATIPKKGLFGCNTTRRIACVQLGELFVTNYKSFVEKPLWEEVSKFDQFFFFFPQSKPTFSKKG